MVYRPKKWRVKSPDPDITNEIAGKLNVSRAAAAVLVNRGVRSVREANAFINPSFFDMETPFALPDMEKAAERLKAAVDAGEKILIYGDRDVDGVTAVSVLYPPLAALGADVTWFIPSSEGYGLHKEIIDRYSESGVKLIVTVDCGISNAAEISYAVSKGIDVVVTDHHEPPEEIPADAIAVVDAKRKDSAAVFQDYAGCAVALKLAQALLMSYDELYGKDLIVVDVETTGLHPQIDEICEIAAVRMRKFSRVEEFQTLARTSRPIPPAATAIHGITNEMCSSAPGPAEVIKKFLDFAGGSVIIAHNAEFDLSFIKNYARKYAGRTFGNRVIDTLTVSREFFPYRSHALGALASDLGLEGFKGHRAMADVEVTIKVFQRLEQLRNKKIRYFLQENLDLISIGTIGDLMPLVSENRTMVKHGLSSLSRTRKAGVRALVEKCVKNPASKPGSKDVSFGIVPLLNACGRRDRADLAVRLLIETETDEADRILLEIEQLNSERKELQALNISKFREMLSQQCDVDKDRLLFVAGEGMEHGVTGIVASQLAREYHMPVLLLIIEDGEAVGSGRSVEGFNFHEAITACADILVKFGGHSAAVGLTVKKEKIEELKERLLKAAGEKVTDEMLEQAIEVDAEIKMSDITPKLLAEIEEMEPFGSENPYPSFLLRQVKVTGFSKMGEGGSHLRLRLGQNGSQIGAVGWRMGELADGVLSSSKYIDIIGQLEMNRWQNKNYLQLLIIDIAPA
jgi:single-stranded-DNA-specific exonuclease